MSGKLYPKEPTESWMGCCLWHAVAMAIVVIALGQGSVVKQTPQEIRIYSASPESSVTSQVQPHYGRAVTGNSSLVGGLRRDHYRPSQLADYARMDVPLHNHALYAGVDTTTKHR
ncbi:hypothetical protein [Magnetococcus sp. PR-3]|uniref:hypothetical protein n=1 Tax=Magnetococcus sp. PR-3 TaxID=3120355 RepID=UPI002FCE60E3